MISARAQALLDKSVIWDNHAGMPIRPGDTTFLPQLQRYRSFGATFVLLNAAFDLMPWHHGSKVLATFRSWLDRHQDDYIRVVGMCGRFVERPRQPARGKAVAR